MKSLIQAALIIFVFVLPLSAQIIDCESSDYQIFKEYTDYISTFNDKNKVELLQKTAEFFLDKPYVAGTLDKNNQEKLVINLREFDCVTYIETVIALANIAERGELSFEKFAAELQRIRYRNGVMSGYDSRLHYTSEWVSNNIKTAVLKPLNRVSGTVTETKTIDFMSSHRSSYNALKNDDAMLNKIKSIEDDINSGKGFYYLPKNIIEIVKDEIPHLAMLGFTTSIKGLDTTHTGFVFKDGEKLTFIHASSLKNKVVIDDKTLQDYCMSQKSCTGIIVAEVK